MGELLHASAFASTAIGACCVAVDRPTARVRELALAAVMLAAMFDVVWGWGVVPALCWAILLGVAGTGSVAGTSRRRVDAVTRGMRAVDGVGAILMAWLLLVMVYGGDAAPTSSGHSHGAGAPTAMLVVACIAYGGVCIAFAARMPVHVPAGRRSSLVRRAAPSMMGASVLFMAAAALA